MRKWMFCLWALLLSAAVCQAQTTVYGGSATSSVEHYNVKDYGVRGDGVFLFDGVITSGSPNLSSASAAWTQADVGKAIEVNNGSTGASVVISTIKTVTDATHVVLNANASASVASGGFIQYGSDDTAAINALITTQFAKGQNFTLYFPCSIYILAGTLGGGGFGQNALIRLPIVVTTASQQMQTIEFDGCAPNSHPLEDAHAGNIMRSGSILYGMTAESGSSPAIIGGPTSALTGGTATFDDITFLMRNMTVRTRQNNSYQAVNLYRIGNVGIYNSRVDVQQGTAADITFPTDANSVGIYMPSNGAYGWETIQDTVVKGYYQGTHINEHVRLASVKLETAAHALDCEAYGHLNEMVNVNFQRSQINLYSTDGCYIHGTMSVEDDSNVSFAYDVYGPFSGSVQWLNSYTFGTPVVSGVTSAFRIENLGASYSGTFTTGTTAIAANTCTSTVQVALTGVTTASAFYVTPSTDTAAVNGWGNNGGLMLDVWPTAGYFNYKICNQTGSSITPGAATFNVSTR